jgi:hypothetical protein
MNSQGQKELEEARWSILQAILWLGHQPGYSSVHQVEGRPIQFQGLGGQ